MRETIGSKRAALEMLPATLVPGLTSFVGLIVIGRVGGGELLGLTSIAVVTANLGSALAALGPGQAALRHVAAGIGSATSQYRALVLRKAIVTGVAGAVAAAGVATVNPAVGRAILYGTAWSFGQAFVLFEFEALKGMSAFRRATAIVTTRAVIGWAASVVAVATSHTIEAAVIPQVVVSLVIAAAFGALRVQSPSRAVIEDGAAIGQPVGRLALLSYAIGYADRYIVLAFAGPVAVGVYTLGYQLGEGLELVSAPVNGALAPRMVREWHDPERGPAVAIRTARRAAVVLVGAGALAPPVFVLADRLGLLGLVNEDDKLLPIASIIAVAVGIQGVTRLAYALLLAEGRTGTAFRVYGLVTIALAIVTPALTWRFGTVGAAWATLIGYVTLASVMSEAARRVVPR